MNKQKMLEIADLLEKSKPENFHMATWFGKLIPASNYENYEDIEDYIDADEMIPEHIGFSRWNPENLFKEEEGSITLNCNTTACIAGWAVANEYFSGNKEVFDLVNSPNFCSVERLGAEFLELNTVESTRLFFCDYGSIWHEVSSDYGFDFEFEIQETWKIHPKHAADVLRRIVNEDLILDKNIEEEAEYY